MDVLDYKMIIRVLEMRRVHFVLVTADIVSERNLPASPLQPNPHQAHSRKELSERAFLRQAEINHGEFLARPRLKRTLFFSYWRQQRKIGINCEADQLI